MAEQSLNRINSWFGGITNDERNYTQGVALNVEELDIFSNPSYMEPTQINSADATITRKIVGYTADDGDNLYASGRTTDPFFQIWKKTTASADSPGAWASFYSSGSVAPCSIAPIMWSKWDAGTKWLYIVTGADNATTRTIYRVKDDAGTVSSTDSGSTTMTLDDLVGSFDRVPTIKIAGELFWGHGKYIAKVDDTGVFTQHAFELPGGWVCVSFAAVGDEMAILAKGVEAGSNVSKVFFWDLTATTGVDDEATVPMGGPQIIANHNEILRVFCAKSSILKIFEMRGKLPVKTHELSNIGVETDTQPIIPDTSKFIKDGVFYFGLWKTDKTGIYALGQADAFKPLALILAKRFHTTDYSAHKPFAATCIGPNFYSAFLDNATNSVAKCETNASPTRSSNAVYESVWLDGGSPETLKEWSGFRLTSKVIPASCTITVDARVDNASSYDSNATKALTNANDQTVLNGTADTHWERLWTSLVGRVLQFKLTFASSSTSKASIYFIGLIQREIS